jgi:hypothetical protein
VDVLVLTGTYDHAVRMHGEQVPVHPLSSPFSDSRTILGFGLLPLRGREGVSYGLAQHTRPHNSPNPVLSDKHNFTCSRASPGHTDRAPSFKFTAM